MTVLTVKQTYSGNMHASLPFPLPCHNVVVCRQQPPRWHGNHLWGYRTSTHFKQPAPPRDNRRYETSESWVGHTVPHLRRSTYELRQLLVWQETKLNQGTLLIKFTCTVTLKELGSHFVFLTFNFQPFLHKCSSCVQNHLSSLRWIFKIFNLLSSLWEMYMYMRNTDSLEFAILILNRNVLCALQ